jgi:hypothetical protein
MQTPRVSNETTLEVYDIYIYIYIYNFKYVLLLAYHDWRWMLCDSLIHLGMKIC